jgi:hypothetical protein
MKLYKTENVDLRARILIIVLVVLTLAIVFITSYGTRQDLVELHDRFADKQDDQYVRGVNDALDVISLVNLEVHLGSERLNFGELAEMTCSRLGVRRHGPTDKPLQRMEIRKQTTVNHDVGLEGRTDTSHGRP